MFDAAVDMVLDEFSKPFQFLNPFQPSAVTSTLSCTDPLLETEADASIQEFSFDHSKIDQADDVKDYAILEVEQMIS
jgi:hypothetical protein